jgi:ABC-type polysaccharide/polyol phosphate export permease
MLGHAARGVSSPVGAYDVIAATDHFLPSPATRLRARAATSDLVDGLTSWRIWIALGLNDVRQRYRRSVLGQFWITLSTGIFVFALGYIYAALFRADTTTFLPYVAVNYIVWTFLSSTVTEACYAFISAEGYLRQERLPKSVFVFRLLVRNVLAFAHNIVVIVVVFAVFGTRPGFGVLAALPGFVLVAINVTFASSLVAIFATRFRDLPQVVANAVMLAFFASPIMWQTSQLPEAARRYVLWNPIVDHLAIVCGPLLGQPPTLGNWLVTLCWTSVLAVMSFAAFARFRGRIVYWL